MAGSGAATTAIRQAALGPVEVVLLEENVETVVTAALRALHRAPATRKPKRNERDAIIENAAHHSDRTVREAILNEVPSLRALVERLAELARRAPT